MSEQTVYKKGVIRALKGLVIKVQFIEDMPEINEMLFVDNKDNRPPCNVLQAQTSNSSIVRL